MWCLRYVHLRNFTIPVQEAQIYRPGMGKFSSRTITASKDKDGSKDSSKVSEEGAAKSQGDRSSEKEGEQKKAGGGGKRYFRDRKANKAKTNDGGE